MLEYMALVVLEPTAFPLKPGTPRISSVPNFMAILRSAGRSSGYSNEDADVLL